MIDALVTGRLTADPKRGTTKAGGTYATARLLVTTNSEERLSGVSDRIRGGQCPAGAVCGRYRHAGR